MHISRHAEKRTEKTEPITVLLEQKGEMLPKAPHLPSVALTHAQLPLWGTGKAGSQQRAPPCWND